MSCWHLGAAFLAVILISFVHGGVLVTPQQPHNLTPEEASSLIKAVKVRSRLTLDLLHALTRLAEANSRGRQLSLYSSEEEEDDNEVVKSAQEVNQIVAKIMEHEKKHGGRLTLKGKSQGNGTSVNSGDIDFISEAELLALERQLEEIVKEGGLKGNSTSLVEGPPPRVTTKATTTAAPGITDRLANIGSYVSRRNILGILTGTRKTVEFLEDIGLVDELSAPITIGDEVLTGLESFFG